MRADRLGLAIAMLLAAGQARADVAAPEPKPTPAPTPEAAAPDEADADLELLEFLAEFSGDDGFVDPFALDKVGDELEREVEAKDMKDRGGAADASAPREEKHGD